MPFQIYQRRPSPTGKPDRGHRLLHPKPQMESPIQLPASESAGKCRVSDLRTTSLGSTGLDLVSAHELILKEQDQIMVVPTGVWGPLPQGTVGLILGRSSMTIEGIFVQPGVVDSDYQGEIKIMLKASGYHIIPAQTRIAQLLLLPYVAPKTQCGERGRKIW